MKTMNIWKALNRRKKIPYEVRWARIDEWVPAMKMVWRTFVKYDGVDFTEEGIQHFLDFITDGCLYASFLKGDYKLMVALDGESIIGAGSIRDHNMLSLLFVEEKYHRKGVGSEILRQLCDYLKTEEGERYMALQAAPCAVNFYRKQGFRAIKPEMEYSGIRVTFMEKIF